MKRSSIVTTILSAMLCPCIVSAQQPFILHDGTPVRLKLNRNLSSADSKVGESADFEVLEDVKIGETLVIARGGIALATVTEAQPKRRMARGGKLNVNIDSVRLVNDDKVGLRAVKETSGGGHTGAMTGAIVASAILFFPAAPLFLFMHGKDITIPKGTEITAYVQGDVTLDPAKFAQAPKTLPQPMPVIAQASGAPMTNQDVIALKAADVSDEVVIAKIKGAPARYKIDTEDIISLKQAKVSDGVIQAMMEAQAHAW